ncbi:MAG: helix-hairpin-helix domain-containing protein [Alistipes sp.]|nr:helix-hairpin-helix domain-containing protein [Alistipes sp.]
MKLFSDRQYRGLLILLPVAVVLVAIAVALELLRPAEQIELEPQSVPTKEQSIEKSQTKEKTIKFQKFNPNSYTYEQLREAGLPKEVAVGIVRWRSYGKVYRLKEDLVLVSGMTDSLYSVLKPYIIIDSEVAAKPKDYTAADGAKYNPQQQCPAQSEQVTEAVKVDEQPSLLELNSADTTQLIAINGIGSKSAAEIVKYRDLLGGYHSVEQILELKCVTEQNYEKILQQICCDSCKISKIDINFATAKAVGRHPYVSKATLRKIFKQRQLKGGWSRIEDLVEDEILSEDEAKRLAPYLWFRLEATE